MSRHILTFALGHSMSAVNCFRRGLLLFATSIIIIDLKMTSLWTKFILGIDIISFSYESIKYNMVRFKFNKILIRFTCERDSL